jgi:hypothetical protein
MRYIELQEAVNDHFLFHAAACDDAARIIVQDCILPKTSHHNERLGYPADSGYRTGVSLTRDLRFARQFRQNGAIFCLNAAKLRHNYPLKPIDYFAARRRGGSHNIKSKTECEEFAITPKGITPLSRYLIAIEIPRAEYERCLEDNEEWGDIEDSRYGTLTNHPLLRIV